MNDASNGEILVTLSEILATVRTIHEAVASHDEELSALHREVTGVLRDATQLQEAVGHLANRVEVCLDTLGAFRTDYLRRFGPEDPT